MKDAEFWELQMAIAAAPRAARDEVMRLRDEVHRLQIGITAERERCAAWVDARRDAFVHDNGSIDPDTGALQFGRGAHAEAKAEYVAELEEIAAGLRALGHNAEAMRHANKDES